MQPSSAGTGYSPDGSFYTEPANQASGVNFASVGSNAMAVNWARGNGNGVIVLMSQGSAVTAVPSDGVYTAYLANSDFGSGTPIVSGNYVVFKGAGTSVTVTGLTPGTTYYLAVYEYAGSVDTSGMDQGTNYKTSPATGNQSTTLSGSLPTLTTPTATLIGSTSVTLGANVTADGGQALTARGTVWGATANPTTNPVAEGGTTTGVFTQARTGLTAGSLIYYRGYATNSDGAAYSQSGSFYTEPATQASGVNVTSVGSNAMTVNWTRGNGDGVIVLMRQGPAVDTDPQDGTYTTYAANPAFGSGTLIGTGNYVVYKGTGTSVSVTGLAGNSPYYLAIYEYQGSADTSGDNQGTNYKSSPATKSQVTSVWPQSTLESPADGTSVLSDVYFQWSAVPSSVEYQVQYSTDVTFNTGVVSSGWISSTSWYPYPGPGTYYWRVQARDSVSLVDGPWSTSWSFMIADGCYGDSCCLYGCSTCPTLYSWDGNKYAFETDTFPTGFLGTKTATGWRKPNPYEYHLLNNTPQMLDGYYSLKIVEERDETDYFDTLKLYAVDYPLDRDLYQELRTAGTYAEPAAMLHTVDKTLLRPLSITYVNTGADASAKLAHSDKDYLILNTDRNIDFNWQTLEIDLGNQALAPQIKLIIDAEMVVPTTSAGMARKTQLSPNGKIVRLEVLDGSGNWLLVPSNVKEVFSPKERSSAYIVDISNIFSSGIYKFRLSFLYKVYVDAIYFDTTLDEPVTVTELPLISATLGYYGFSQKTEGEIFDYIYGDIVSRDTSYFTGNYTKYGDVTQLLTQTDDKFTVFAGGEELDVRFTADSQSPVGKSRRYLVYANGYYKATGNIDITHTVEPLPFNAMSNYPYDSAVEHYPDDAEHNLYRIEYNTREYPQ